MDAFNTFTSCSGLKANLDKSQIVFSTNCTRTHQDCLEITGFTEGHLPIKYLGMPITASRMTKMECRLLVEKFTTRIKSWTSRNISYAGTVTLMKMNTVLFGMFTFWARIFILPQEVVNEVTKVCRNFLWGGEAEYKKAPYVAWNTICQPKNQGGLGVKNLSLWNTACIAKLVWAIAQKNNHLWVKWIHNRYIKNKGWRGYTSTGDTSWYWKKLQGVKERFSTYPKDEYKVNEGYKWLLNSATNTPWVDIIWSRTSTPRHSFIAWLLMQSKLPVLQHIGRFTQIPSMQCRLCQCDIETQEYLFFECAYAVEIWTRFERHWGLKLQIIGMEQGIRSVYNLKLRRKTRRLVYAMITAIIYNIWQARNHLIFKNQRTTP